MENIEMIDIVMPDGSVDNVELVTYLMSEDNISTYIVYSKGEKQGIEEDEIIYISKLVDSDVGLSVIEIETDEEWTEVLRLLKKIANA